MSPLSTLQLGHHCPKSCHPHSPVCLCLSCLRLLGGEPVTLLQAAPLSPANLRLDPMVTLRP